MVITKGAGQANHRTSTLVWVSRDHPTDYNANIPSASVIDVFDKTMCLFPGTGNRIFIQAAAYSLWIDISHGSCDNRPAERLNVRKL